MVFSRQIENLPAYQSLVARNHRIPIVSDFAKDNRDGCAALRPKCTKVHGRGENVERNRDEASVFVHSRRGGENRMHAEASLRIGFVVYIGRNCVSYDIVVHGTYPVHAQQDINFCTNIQVRWCVRFTRIGDLGIGLRQTEYVLPDIIISV